MESERRHSVSPSLTTSITLDRDYLLPGKQSTLKRLLHFKEVVQREVLEVPPLPEMPVVSQEPLSLSRKRVRGGVCEEMGVEKVMVGDGVGDGVVDVVGNVMGDGVVDVVGNVMGDGVVDVVGNVMSDVVDHAVDNVMSDVVDHAVDNVMSDVVDHAVEHAVNNAVNIVINNVVGYTVNDKMTDAVTNTATPETLEESPLEQPLTQLPQLPTPPTQLATKHTLPELPIPPAELTVGQSPVEPPPQPVTKQSIPVPLPSLHPNTPPDTMESESESSDDTIVSENDVPPPDKPRTWFSLLKAILQPFSSLLYRVY